MSTAPRDGSLKTTLSRPPMLPHSLSLGHLPGPNFASLPSGQRSVPATDAFTRLTNGDRVSTPTSDGIRTPGAVGERVRRDSFEPWTSENEKIGPVDRTMEVGRRTVQFDNLPTNIGTAAGRAGLTDYRRSTAQAESVSPTSTIHPLNRAPGSRDGLANTPTSVGRKSLGMSATTPTAGLGFNISHAIPESEVVDYSTDSSIINGTDKARSASISFDLQGRPNRSHAHNRKSSQPTPVSFASGSIDQDSLIAGMGSLAFNELSKRRLTESTLPSLRSNGGASTHRPSLPATVLRSSNNDGLNAYYGNAASYLSGHEGSPFIGADSGYELTPGQANPSDLRRNSYSPNLNPTASTLGNLRRSQSAWHIHDAFSGANAAPSRQPSLSYGAPLGRTTAPFLQNPFGTNPQAGYTGKSSPTMSPLDLPHNAAVNGLLAGSSLLAQQQLLNEMRRQSLARQAMELSQLGLINPFGLGYGVQPSLPLAQTALAQNALAQNALAQNALAQNALAQNALPQNGGGAAAYPANSNRTSFESSKGAQRSMILEEFRGNKHRRWELKDMLGHIVEFAGDQLGSRHIQSKLDTATTEDKELVFAEIFPNVLQLSMDVFANYVVQKFFEQGNQTQKAQLADALRGHVLQLSLQMYGCRVVQKALEHVLVDQQHALVKELEGEVMQCAKDQNANHVLQRSLELIDSTTNQFITQAFMGQAFTLATHAYGCRVLQRVFEHSAPAQSRPLLEELHRYSHNLMTDQYGNYVAQWIITDGQPEDSALMISKVKGQTLQLSKHKFASNVVEKAVLKAKPDDLRFMIDEILSPRNDGASTIGIMLKDAFANFPLQKFLLMAKEPQRAILFKETATQLTQMRKYSLSYGKYLVALERLVTNELGPLVDDTSIATAGPAPESA